MVDAAQVRKINPNYARPSLIRAANKRLCDSHTIDLLDGSDNRPPPPGTDQVKVNDTDINMQDEDNLIVCSPTVLSYSLNDKSWGKNPAS